jgi:serine/threonine-protein kinase HipA
MINNAFVYIWNQRVGAVSWDSEQQLGTFEYDKSFLQKGWQLSPFLMPIQNGEQFFQFPENRHSSTFKGLPGLLADVLPDKYGNALINAWLAKQGRPSNSLNPVETLCFIGKRGMGALEFEPVQPKSTNISSPVELSHLVDIAEEILTGRKDFSANLSTSDEKALFEILKIGSSAGGARAKALIAFNEITGETRSGQAAAPNGFEHWLIKFDGVADTQFGASMGYGRVEMAYYQMAIDAGIQMMESRLLEENNRAHFMTKRFDRPNRDEKLHVQTFCALRHLDFNEVHLFSYEELFETMRMLGLSYASAQELFRRMVFNVLAKNCDDHTKNFAFIMDQNGQWDLAPAYDICHAYRPGSEWVSQHALSINGKRKDITRQDLLLVAKNMNIKNPAKIIDNVSSVVSQWKTYANAVQVDELLRDSIDKTLLIL